MSPRDKRYYVDSNPSTEVLGYFRTSLWDRVWLVYVPAISRPFCLPLNSHNDVVSFSLVISERPPIVVLLIRADAVEQEAALGTLVG